MAPHPFLRSGQRPLVLGHRGLPARHQENSLAGFRACAALGIDGVELDVFLTRDEKVVVFHDEDTLRLTGEPGNIYQLTYAELSQRKLQRSIDMGGSRVSYPSEEPIPLLEHVLEEFRDKLLINIELKAYGVHWSKRHVGTHVARIVRDHAAEQRTIVTSFNPFMLGCVQRENPKLRFGFTWDDDMLKPIADLRNFIHQRLPLHAHELKQKFLRESLPSWVLERVMGRVLDTRAVGIEYTLLQDDTVPKAHARDLAVGAYTLFPLDTRFSQEVGSGEQQERTLLQLASYGVDWIETDDAERALAVLLRKQPAAAPEIVRVA